jgi:adenylosuccinate lyase
LQRTEVREVMEGFKPGQKGSSAMPHKRNPISAETISGLSRVLRGNLQAGLSRDDAYRIVQTNAMRAWDEHIDFRDLLEADPSVASLDVAALDAAFDLDRSLRNVGAVFDALDAVEV